MKNKYSMFSFDTLTFFLIASLSSNIGYLTFIKDTKIDTIFLILIGSVLGLIPIYIYNKIISYNEDRNIIENIEYLFPKINLFIKIILIITSFLIMCISLKEISSFINIYLLKNTNTLFISSIFLLLVLYTSSKGINTIVKASTICFYLFVFINILSIVGTINLVDLNNLKPFFISNKISLLIDSVIYSFLSTSPLFMLSIIKKKDLNKKNYLKSNLYKTYIFTSIFIVIEFIFTLGILGITLLNIYKYPAINIYKKISFLNIFERVESFFAIKFLFYSFFLISISLIFVLHLSKSLLKNKKKDNLLLASYFLLIIFISFFCKFDFSIYLISSYLLGIFIPIIIYIKMIILSK